MEMFIRSHGIETGLDYSPIVYAGFRRALIGAIAGFVGVLVVVALVADVDDHDRLNGWLLTDFGVLGFGALRRCFAGGLGVVARLLVQDLM